MNRDAGTPGRASPDPPPAAFDPFPKALAGGCLCVLFGSTAVLILIALISRTFTLGDEAFIFLGGAAFFIGPIALLEALAFVAWLRKRIPPEAPPGRIYGVSVLYGLALGLLHFAALLVVVALATRELPDLPPTILSLILAPFLAAGLGLGLGCGWAFARRPKSAA